LDILSQSPTFQEFHTDRIKSSAPTSRGNGDPSSIPSIFDQLVEADPQLPRRLSQVPGAEQLFVGVGE